MNTMKNFALGLGCLALLTPGAPAFSQDAYPWAPVLGSLTTEQVYTPVTPCRFVDGINAADRVAVTVPNGTTSRYYRVRGTTTSDFVSQGAGATAPTGCGIPTSATSVMVNLTVADPDADGDLRVDPANVLIPSNTSVLNYTFGGVRGKNLANAVVVKLCDLTVGSCASGGTPALPTRDILVTFHAGASAVSTYFIADVLGYFSPAVGAAGPTGPTGPTGPAGPTQIVGMTKVNVGWGSSVPCGTTFTGGGYPVSGALTTDTVVMHELSPHVMPYWASQKAFVSSAGLIGVRLSIASTANGCPGVAPVGSVPVLIIVYRP